MNDNYQDYSTEGTAPVVVPGSDSVPEPVVAPDNPILLPAPGPGPSKSPMSKQMKIMLGLFSAVILVSGLATSLFLVKQKQNINSRAMPNTCTWDTCGEDPAKWAAGAYDEKRIEHLGENPNADAALLNTLNTTLDSNSSQKQDVINDFKSTVATVVNNANNGGDINNITEINKFLNTSNTSGTILSTNEIQLFSQVTNTTGSQASTNIATQTPLVGGLPLKDTVMGQSIDNACNYNMKCEKYSDWQKGWDLARHSQDYLNKNLTPRQTEYTDVAKDLDPSTPLHQVGTIEKDSSGKLVITQVFSVTSNSGNCADTNESCWITELNRNGYSFSIAPVGKMVDGKIVYNQLGSAGTTSSSFVPNVGVNMTFGLKNPNFGKNLNDTNCISTTYPNGVSCRTTGMNVTSQYLQAGNVSADGKTLTFTGEELKQSWPKAIFPLGFTLTLDLVTRAFNKTQLGDFINYVNTAYGSNTTYWSASSNYCKDQTNLTGGCSNPVYFDQKQFDAGKTLSAANGCGVTQLDFDMGGGHLSVNFLSTTGNGCGPAPAGPPGPTPPGGPTVGGGGNPPTTTTFSGPTPTPTTPINPLLACYQLQIFRGGTQIQPWQINQGDALTFRGFASVSGGATVSRMRFVVTVGGVAQAPVDVNATLVGGMYQADYNYTITQNTSYSVSTTPI